MNKGKRPIGKILMILSVVFFYLPILYMIIFSFNDGKSLTSFTGFSLRWYKHMLESADMMDALSTTFSIALLATFISTVAGTIAAIGVSKSKKLIRDLMEQANNLPIMNPEIVTAIGFMLLFITFHVEKGYVTMLLAHIAFCIPYVMLSVMPKIKSLDPNLADAAMDLGATPWQALTKVVVPQITPGIVAGALIAFTMSVDDFIISYFVTGRGVKNLSIMVYTMSKRVNPSINAISTLVVVIITIVLVIINAAPALFAKRAKRNSIGRRNVLVPAIAVVCALAVVAGVVTYNNKKEPLPFEGQTLRIYNWGEYVGEHIIQDFQKETGATVLLENFDSNEQMYIKVANGEAYDILVPSDYMIQRLISEGYLQKLDKSKLNCMGKLYDAVKGLPYDPENEYSVPYFWGTVGIVYDKTKVDIKDLEKEGYNIFLDQKYNRLAIQKLCKNAKVLDCFTHTGSFALNAGIAGASEVTGVDASQLAVDQATANARLNGLDGTVKFICEDVFELLPELEERGEKFDVVILDPPAFTKSRNSVKNAVKGYREINLRAMKLVKDGGFLATCSCSHFMTYELFTKTVGQAARSTHKRLRQVEYRTQAPDHPILWASDESYYLKFYIFQVCSER